MLAGAARRDQDVGRLDVAMDEALAVSGVELNNVPSSSPAEYTGITLGCSNWAAMADSRWNRAANRGSSASSGAITLSATLRSGRRWLAR